MLPYESFFYGGLAFLVGIFSASIGMPPLFVLGSTLATSALFLFFYWLDSDTRNKWFAGLILFMIVGSFYYRVYDARFRSARISFGKMTVLVGLVASDPVKNGDTQEMKILIQKPFEATLLTRVRNGTFAYGEVIQGRGIVERPQDDGYARYLEGQYVRGVISLLDAQKIDANKGSFIKTKLLEIKHSIVTSFASILPPEESVFLSGLTIGARGEFSKELKDAMQKSGTTHLIALSGYNISILVLVLMSVLLSLVSRRTAFLIAIPAIIGFVIMTGGESSVVRASLIGFIVLLAREIGRAHDIRNIILCSALVMVLVNPKVLVFDVGFQLSFLALLGIVYINPILAPLFGMREKKDESFLSWKTNAITTASAQLATLPILISNFGTFSIVSLISNIMILEFIPITMALGFVTALFAFVSRYLALIPGLLVSLFLKSELSIIYVFAKISVPISFTMNALFILLYYSVLIFGVASMKKRISRAKIENS